MEEVILKNQTKRLSELAEVGQNLTREETRRQGQKLDRIPSTNIPEGWMRKQSNHDKNEQTRDEKTAKKSSLEEHWVRLMSSRDYIVTNEDWMSTNRYRNIERRLMGRTYREN